MKGIFLPVLVVASLLLGACARSAAARPATANPTPEPTVFAPTEALPAPTVQSQPSADLTRVDQQGMVVVEVTPRNLKDAGDTLEFDVAMNTHSVDLSMDLAALATVTTDTGVSVAAAAWDAPPGGGHHVSGKLTFPATKDGKSILDGVTELTLTILNVDAPSRTFEWQLR